MSNTGEKYELRPENDPIDMAIVMTHKIACDGGGGALGHPKVWLDMGQDIQVQCKYCDKIFVLSPEARASGH